jgi:hypothetical protein
VILDEHLASLIVHPVMQVSKFLKSVQPIPPFRPKREKLGMDWYASAMSGAGEN